MESQAKQHATDQQIQGKEQKGTHGDRVTTSLQALLESHETCDLLVPSKASPISLPTPLLLLYEFH